MLYKFGIDVGKGDYRFKLRISSGIPENGPETYSTTFEVHIDDYLDDVYG